MTRHALLTALVLPAALTAASCGAQSTGETSREAQSTPAPTAENARPFTIKEHGAHDEPWAAAFVPGTSVLVMTLKGGKMMGVETQNDRAIFFEGVPKVDYGGQGGLGDVAFLPSEASSTLSPRTIYLSWVEAGEGDTRGAAVGKGRMVCEEHQTCRIDDLEVIWRQPKVSGRGHFSHRITFSPDERYMFVASGDRQKMEPAQDLSNTLGSIVRLTLDGKPAPGNPFADRGGPSDQIWSYGHRNTLGLKFDEQGRLWNLEHGPQGGDELNLVERGANYGWPVVSNGVHYGGGAIPDHSTRPEFKAPAAGWTPVIAPGDFIFYSGKLWPEWKGDALIAAMKPSGLVRVEFDGARAREAARYPFDKRIREIVEGPDGALWLLEDKEGGRLLELRPG